MDLVADLEELNLDRPTKPPKTNEELEKLTVDEKLTGIERAVYLLSSGQEVQRISVITDLPTLLKENNAECMRRVVPKVREVLYVAQQDMQLAASSAFLQILQDKLVPLQSYAQTFLQTILQGIDSKDPEVSAAWLGTLLDVIGLLPVDVIKKDILTIAINKGQLQQPVQIRLSCCKILGKIATKFDSALIKKEILPIVLQLCQDVEHEVRACMCGELDSVARGSGLEQTKTAILPELVELSNDEESNVRITGLDAVVSMLDMLDCDSLTNTIIPLVCKVCQKALQAEDRTLQEVAKQLGRLCIGLQEHLLEDQKQWFVDFYKKLCRVGLPDKKHPTSQADEDNWLMETRVNAAWNFPALTAFVGSRLFKNDLYPSLNALTKDVSPHVRRTAAKGFHEVCKLLGSEVTLLFPNMILLLKDENVEVVDGAISSFPLCLDVIMKISSANDSKIASAMEVVSAYLLADSVVFASNKWRTQENMMRHMSGLGKICPQDMLYNKIVPVLLAKMKNGRALPVRYAASRSLLVLTRKLTKQEWREQIVATLIEEFCHSRSCHRRKLFLVVCSYFVELYSKAFVKERFFDLILSLTGDPVPNVRMKSCSLLPALKRQIKLPYDNNLKSSLEQCIRKILVNDPDNDVRVAMQAAVVELDQIYIQMESQLSHRKNFEDDADDTRKEAEEKHLFVLEERERKEEEMRREKKHQASKLPQKKAANKTSNDKLTPKNETVHRKDSTKSVASDKSSAASMPTPGNSVNKTKASSSQRTPNLLNPASSVGNSPPRKGSVGSLPSVPPRRGSLGSANSTRSEPGGRGGAKGATSGTGGMGSKSKRSSKP